MAKFQGDISEYREFEPGRWRREDAKGDWIEGDGITTLSPGVAFAEVFERRNNPPAAPVILPYGAFLARWTDAELEALFGARKTDWRVDNLVTLAAAQDSVNLSGERAAQAKALFVALKVLSRARADIVFSAS